MNIELNDGEMLNVIWVCNCYIDQNNPRFVVIEQVNNINKIVQCDSESEATQLYNDIIAAMKSSGGGSNITKLSQLENDTGFITNLVSNLVNYYSKSDTYSMSQVDNLIASLTSISFTIVDTLPSIGEASLIYLLPNADGYDQYIYANSVWAKIGDTSINLDGYAKIEDIPTKLSELANDTNFATTAEVESKQDRLITGTGIDIVNNVISSTIEPGIKTYAEASDKPKINGVTLEGNKTSSQLGLSQPTKLSELDNDENFIDKEYVDTKLDTKQAQLESGVNIKTINGQTILGEGNIQIEGGGGSGSITSVNGDVGPNVILTAENIEFNDGETIEDKVLNHINNTLNPHEVTKTQIGLGSVDNTSDIDKPLSEAAIEKFNEIETAIPSVLSELTNDTGFITNTVSDLINYYSKTETFTKNEVNNLIANIESVRFLIVSELPLEGENNIIYLLANGDVYDEYIYTNDKWEIIGNTNIDLSEYAKIADLPTKLSQLTNDEAFIKNTVADLTNYYNKTEVDDSLSIKQDELISGTNIKTINGQSLLGEGNIAVEGGGTLPSDENYSALHQGNFVNLFEKDKVLEEVDVLVAEAGEYQISFPVYLNSASNLIRNKGIGSIGSNIYSTDSILVGYNVLSRIDGSLTVAEIDSFDDWIAKIKPTNIDTNNITTFKLDGTDDRVEINPNCLKDVKGLPLIPDNGYLGFKNELSPRGGIPFGCTVNKLPTPSQDWFGIANNVVFISDTDDVNLSINVSVFAEVGEGYKVEDLRDIDNRIKVLEQEETADSILKGKTISFLGDSITEQGWMPNNYVDQIISKEGMILEKNNSISGSRLSGVGGAIETNRCTDLGTNPDYIIVNMGTNDFLQNVPVGDWDGTKTVPTTYNTYRDALAFATKQIIEAYPSSQVWLCTMTLGDPYNTPSFPESNTQGLASEYNNAIIEVASAMGVKVCQLGQSGITIFNIDTYTTDGLHPNEEGHTLYYKQLSGQLKSNSTGIVKVGSKEEGNLPINDKYSVLNEGEFVDLFEKQSGTHLVEYNSTENKGQDETTNSNPASSPFSIVNPLVSYRNSYLKSISFKPSSSSFKTSIGYIDNGLDYGAFTDWYFDIMANTEDVGVLTEFALDGTDARVTVNTNFVDAEKGMIKTLDKEGVYLSVGSPDGASFYYGGSPDGTTSGTTFKTRTAGGALNTTNLGMYLKVVKEEIIPEGYKIPELEEINANIETRVSFIESMTLTEEEKSIARENIGISSTSDYNPLKGKKISFLGDSITTYSGWIPAGNATFYPNQDVQNVNDTYWKKLVDNLELDLVVNNSWSGSVIARGGTGSVIDQKRYEELHTAEKTPDIIFINMGTNDFRRNIPLGEYNGLSTTPTIDECYSFRESYAYILSEISKAYPTAQIWCSSLATQDSVGSTAGYPEINGDGVVIHEYNNAVRELATAYGAKIIELASCGITSFNLLNYMGDKLHPNKAGMELYYNQAKGQLISNATTALKIGGTDGNTEVVQTTGTSTTSVMSQKAATDNFLPKEVNSDYSVIHEGKLLDIATKNEDTIRESASGYPESTSASIPTVAPFYLTNGQDIQGKYILDFTYIPKNNMPLVVGALNVSTFEEAQTLGMGIRTFTEVLFTINPLSEEMNKATTYKLDGTDSRVVINIDVTENNKVKLKEGYSIGLEEYSTSALGSFGYTSYGSGNGVNSFYRYTTGVVAKDLANELCIGFTLSDGSEHGYQIPVIEEFNNRIEELENTSLKYTEQILTEAEQTQARENIGLKSGNITDNVTFMNTDLVDNKLTVIHNRNSTNVIVSVYSNTEALIIPSEVIIKDAKTVEIDFENITISETWRVVIQGGDAVVSGVINNAVLFTQQTLNNEQKQQAKNNLDLNMDLQIVADLIPTNLSELTNDANFITNLVTDLENYYDKAEVDTIVSAINQLLTYSVVVELPTSDIKTNVIYLTLEEGSTNNYLMNMYIDNAWYMLGDTAIDLTQYVTLVEYNNRIAILEAALNTKTNNTNIKTVLDTTLTTNTEYTVNLSSNTIIEGADGWGTINITALANLNITIPSGHKWSEGKDGYIENGTQTMFMYDNSRWTRIDWR